MLAPAAVAGCREIGEFAARVEGSTLRFAAMSYPELWAAWDDTGGPFLCAHVAALRARYEVPGWAWGSVEWRDGRLCSASFLDDLLDDPEADREAAEEAIKRAMFHRGMSEDLARRMYGA